MANDTLRHRQKAGQTEKSNDIGEKAVEGHPAGDIKHGQFIQLLRLLLFVIYTVGSSCAIYGTQLVGAPLYFYDKNLFYAYMAVTKQSFGILVTTVTQWWTPTIVRISGDASVAGQLRVTPDGRVECRFPDRIVLIANHQIYSDWLYLWWVAYTNQPRMHGHIFIILKESLKYLPIVGWGMMFYGFIFMSRKMSKDQERLEHRLKKLKERHSGPMSGSKGLDPMWLLIFPEGTNASDNGRIKSAAWAKKVGIKDTEHMLLPRSTGSFFCLNELKGSVDYVYDCTMAYEGVPRGGFGEDYYTLGSMYFQGRPPPSVNLYWRRFAVNDIPLDNHEEFDLWLREKWYEKDAIMEQYIVNGRFPASAEAMSETEGDRDGYIETEVKLASWFGLAPLIFVWAGLALEIYALRKVWGWLV